MRIRILLAAATLALPLVAHAADATTPPTATTAPVVATTPAAPAVTAEAVLRELYTGYFAKLNAGESANMHDVAARYFEPELASKFAAATAGNEVGAIDFDVFIYAQDFEELTLDEVKRTFENPTKAIFEVRFTNNGDQQKLRFGMTKVAGAWKIADIEFPDGASLRKMLEGEPAAAE